MDTSNLKYLIKYNVDSCERSSKEKGNKPIVVYDFNFNFKRNVTIE